VLYIVTGDNDAFAIDVETGTVLWEYEAKIDEDVARPCCGWAARGVALGDGKVFVGQVSPAAIWERAAAGLTTLAAAAVSVRARKSGSA
jgi:glucose dehydrogenase